MFESKAGILWIGGLGFFAFAFLSNGLVPMLMYRKLPEKTAEEVVNQRVCVFTERPPSGAQGVAPCTGAWPAPCWAWQLPVRRRACRCSRRWRFS